MARWRKWSRKTSVSAASKSKRSTRSPATANHTPSCCSTDSRSSSKVSISTNTTRRPDITWQKNWCARISNWWNGTIWTPSACAITRKTADSTSFVTNTDCMFTTKPISNRTACTTTCAKAVRWETTRNGWNRIWTVQSTCTNATKIIRP